jgi:hypothetical protein
MPFTTNPMRLYENMYVRGICSLWNVNYKEES